MRWAGKGGVKLVFGDPESIAIRDAARKKARQSKPKTPAEKLAMMHRFGVTEGRKCGDCQFLIRQHGGVHAYSKCQKYGISHGSATDWSVRHTACGLFKEPLEAAK